jgi:hypothetical protein
LAFEQHLLQKMNFYASIVAYLDMSFAELRGLHDKGRVSIYHIIDYVLKFYVTGFFQRDIEHANFMTTREELYPTRQLAALILRVLEGRQSRIPHVAPCGARSQRDVSALRAGAVGTPPHPRGFQKRVRAPREDARLRR